jgi:hypothetical protein
MELWRIFRRPRVLLEIGCQNAFRKFPAEFAEGFQIEVQMERAKWLEICKGKMKQPHRWAQTPPIFGMMRSEMLLLQMNKCSRSLDHPFVVSMVFIPASKPEMFQHIMRFVIALLIETDEITLVTRMQRKLTVHRETRSKSGDALAFVHEWHRSIADASATERIRTHSRRRHFPCADSQLCNDRRVPPRRSNACPARVILV